MIISLSPLGGMGSIIGTPSSQTHLPHHTHLLNATSEAGVVECRKDNYSCIDPAYTYIYYLLLFYVLYQSLYQLYVYTYLQEPAAQDTASGVPNIPHKLLQTGHQLICVQYVLQRLWWSKRVTWQLFWEAMPTAPSHTIYHWTAIVCISAHACVL